ncbi:hypothetical protein [Brevibacterium sp. XM4083]|uniref:hypothetical protein n=1 Tax=Brevibacterium sp. XM4083 TaxID=2583238 RepID=UPI0011297E0C|nr:hypothetical protein [Brevibacterium sp. XM4083]MCM1012846.1 hypothetical protein [Brevibacterium sp. XM4083]
MVFVSETGALEGSLVTAVREYCKSAPVFHIRYPSEGFFETPPTPAWVEPMGTKTPLTRLSRSFFKALAENRQVSHVIAVGTQAIIRASSIGLDLPLIGIVPRGSVDFSRRRKQLQLDFQVASESCDLLLFDSFHEMDKATSHNSQAPHFLLPLFSASSNFLTGSIKSPHVSIVVPDDCNEERRNELAKGLKDSRIGSTVQYSIVESGSLYSETDFTSARGFPGTLRYRFPKATTHVLIAGNSRNHAALVAALEFNHPDRYVLDATISNRELAVRYGIDPAKYGQGAALFQRLSDLVTSDTPSKSTDGQHSEAHSGVLSGVELLAHLTDVAGREVAWWFEEGICEPVVGPFDVFFSVAAVEDRADGARPMRIRAVSESFGSGDVMTVRLSASDNIFKRRSLAILNILDAGGRPRYFYGESSTAPMHPQVVDSLSRLLRRLVGDGLRVAWFLRDLHWLSRDADFSANTDLEEQARVERGLHEVRSLIPLADILYAPSSRSAVMFQELLSEYNIFDSQWSPLPPAVSDYRSLSSSDLSLHGSPKFVYSGGYGDVYQMDDLISAFGAHDSPVDMRWYIRPSDSGRLMSDLAKSRSAYENDLRPDATDSASIDGLLPHGHSIDHTEFSQFSPGDGRYIGLVLLDSDYAKDSFPYKVMSYLEKRIPVAVFDDMGVSEFIEEHGLGVAIRREGFSLRSLIQQIEIFYERQTEWSEVHRLHSWKARMDEVRRALSALDRLS